LPLVKRVISGFYSNTSIGLVNLFIFGSLLLLLIPGRVHSQELSGVGGWIYLVGWEW
jgi:hypothetical protein